MTARQPGSAVKMSGQGQPGSESDMASDGAIHSAASQSASCFRPSGPAVLQPCSKATSAIVVEGPGKRGEVVHVCADPECEVHGKPNYRAEQEVAERERQREWKRQQEQRQRDRANNRLLPEAVLDSIPKALTAALRVRSISTPPR